jgi:hypothetical protein
MDIAIYLQKEKNLSVEAIAASMDTTLEHVEKVISKKEQFTPEDINTYLKTSELHFWEFILEAVPLNHLTEKIKKRILLCKEMSDHLKKKKL